ncbi:MAG: glutaredoxin family protein [Proteobacteria bacterium]|nr:glutaredoxin family protein [Pseudomonadota bacterium]
MRTILFGGLLLVMLGVGVVQANRDGEEGGFVSGWIASPQRSPEAAAAPAAKAPDTTPRTAMSAAEPSVLAAGELSVIDSDAQVPMVRYFDAGGSLHMVRGFAQVPAQHRADAVVVGRGNVNVVSIPAPTRVAFQDWQPASNPSRKEVVLFSATWCGACKRAKRHLDRQGVRYEERDIDDDASAKQEVRDILGGRIAVPLLSVDGRYISGFRPDVYDQALGKS